MAGELRPSEMRLSASLNHYLPHNSSETGFASISVCLDLRPPSRQSCEVKMVRQKLFAILVRAISVIYDHFSIEKVNLETSDIHICPRKIVGKIFVHIGQTSSISRLIDSLSQFQEFCRSNPEICYPWTVWELSRELFVKITCLLKIHWFIDCVNIWNRRRSTEKSSKKLRVWNNVRVTRRGDMLVILYPKLF